MLSTRTVFEQCLGVGGEEVTYRKVSWVVIQKFQQNRDRVGGIKCLVEKGVGIWESFVEITHDSFVERGFKLHVADCVGRGQDVSDTDEV